MRIKKEFIKKVIGILSVIVCLAIDVLLNLLLMRLGRFFAVFSVIGIAIQTVFFINMTTAARYYDITYEEYIRRILDHVFEFDDKPNEEEKQSVSLDNSKQDEDKPEKENPFRQSTYGYVVPMEINCGWSNQSSYIIPSNEIVNTSTYPIGNSIINGSCDNLSIINSMKQCCCEQKPFTADPKEIEKQLKEHLSNTGITETTIMALMIGYMMGQTTYGVHQGMADTWRSIV